MERLRKIIEEKIDISESDWEIILSKLQYQEIKKKDFLTSTSAIENKVYFILEGVFRLFIELPEKDVTIDFGFPNKFLSSYSSFLMQQPSVSCIQSLTTSKVIFITRNDLYDIYKETTAGEAIGRLFAEEFFRYKSKRELSFMMSSSLEPLGPSSGPSIARHSMQANSSGKFVFLAAILRFSRTVERHAQLPTTALLLGRSQDRQHRARLRATEPDAANHQRADFLARTDLRH